MWPKLVIFWRHLMKIGFQNLKGFSKKFEIEADIAEAESIRALSKTEFNQTGYIKTFSIHVCGQMKDCS